MSENFVISSFQKPNRVTKNAAFRAGAQDGYSCEEGQNV